MENVPDQGGQQQYAPEPAPVAEEAKKGAAYGSMLGIVLIVAVLVVGAFYVWGERLKTETPPVPEEGVRGGDANPDGALDGSVEGSLDVDLGEPTLQ